MIPEIQLQPSRSASIEGYPPEVQTPLPTTPVLRTERLSFAANGHTIVDAISLDVCPGEIIAIVGKSGSGKTSFLRLLNRLAEPTGGTVYLDGQDYRQLPPRLLRQRVGMVLQSAYLFPGTVADNLRFGPRQR